MLFDVPLKIGFRLSLLIDFPRFLGDFVVFRFEQQVAVELGDRRATIGYETIAVDLRGFSRRFRVLARARDPVFGSS